MTQFWCLNKISKQIKSTQSQFISGNHCEPGTSGCESGNSGIIRIHRVCFRILRAWFCHRDPTNVLNLSLTPQPISHSLPSALSPSRSHSPPNPRAPTPFQFDLKDKGASNRRGGPPTPRASLWGGFSFNGVASVSTWEGTQARAKWIDHSRMF
jgi:hypothetical protein